MLRTCSFSCNSQWQPAQTNIRVRLRLSGTSLYPSCLLANKSKASLMRFAFISARDEHHPRRLSNFAKTVFIKKRKSFSTRDSLFCDSFLSSLSAVSARSFYRSQPKPKGALHVAKGTSLKKIKENVLWRVRKNKRVFIF